MDEPTILLALLFAALVPLLGTALLFWRCHHPVASHQALVVRGGAPQPRVAFQSMMVFPWQTAEALDLSVRVVRHAASGRRAPACRDGVRVALTATMLLHVPRTAEAVLRVAETFGCAKANDPAAIEQAFHGRLAQAVEEVMSALYLEDVQRDRLAISDEIAKVIGTDLGGFALENVALSEVLVVPAEQLDPNDPGDARGIKKLVELAAEQNVRANELRRQEQEIVARQNLQASEAILRFEQERALTEARQKREIELVIARERREVEESGSKEKELTEAALARAEAEIAAKLSDPKV